MAKIKTKWVRCSACQEHKHCRKIKGALRKSVWLCVLCVVEAEIQGYDTGLKEN